MCELIRLEQVMMPLCIAMCHFAVIFYSSYTSSHIEGESPHVEVRALPWAVGSNTKAQTWEHSMRSCNGTRNYVGDSGSGRTQGKSDLVNSSLADCESQHAMSRLAIDLERIPDGEEEFPDWLVTLEQTMCGNGGDVKITHEGRKRTINLGGLFLLGLGFPTILDFDNVFPQDIDWDNVRLQEFYDADLNDIGGFFDLQRMLFVNDLIYELDYDEFLFLKLNKILAQALIKAI